MRLFAAAAAFVASLVAAPAMADHDLWPALPHGGFDLTQHLISELSNVDASADATDNQILVGNGSAYQGKLLADCGTTGKIRFNDTTNNFECLNDLNAAAAQAGDICFVNAISGIDSNTCGIGGTCDGDGATCFGNQDCVGRGGSEICENITQQDSPCRTIMGCVRNLDFCSINRPCVITMAPGTIDASAVDADTYRCLGDWDQTCETANGDADCSAVNNPVADAFFEGGQQCENAAYFARQISFGIEDGDLCFSRCTDDANARVGCFQDRDCPQLGTCTTTGGTPADTRCHLDGSQAGSACNATDTCDFTTLTLDACSDIPAGMCDGDGSVCTSNADCTGRGGSEVCDGLPTEDVGNADGRTVACVARDGIRIVGIARSVNIIQGNLAAGGPDLDNIVFDYSFSQGLQIQDVLLKTTTGLTANQCLLGSRGGALTNRMTGVSLGGVSQGTSDVGDNSHWCLLGYGNLTNGYWEAYIANGNAGADNVMVHLQTSANVGKPAEAVDTRFGVRGCQAGACDADGDGTLDALGSRGVCTVDGDCAGATPKCWLNYCSSGDMGIAEWIEGQSNISGVLIDQAEGRCDVDDTDCYFDSHCASGVCDKNVGQFANVTVSGNPALPIQIGNDAARGECIGGSNPGVRCLDDDTPLDPNDGACSVGGGVCGGECVGGTNAGASCTIDANCNSNNCGPGFYAYSDVDIGTCDPAIGTGNHREWCGDDSDCPDSTAGACDKTAWMKQHFAVLALCHNVTDAQGCAVGAEITDLNIQQIPVSNRTPEISIGSFGANLVQTNNLDWTDNIVLNGGTLPPAYLFAPRYRFLLLESVAADPTGESLQSDMLWLNSTDSSLKWHLNGTTFTFSPIGTLGDLDDVTDSGATVNEVLTCLAETGGNCTDWQPAAVPEDDVHSENGAAISNPVDWINPNSDSTTGVRLDVVLDDETVGTWTIEQTDDTNNVVQMIWSIQNTSTTANHDLTFVTDTNDDSFLILEKGASDESFIVVRPDTLNQALFGQDGSENLIIRNTSGNNDIIFSAKLNTTQTTLLTLDAVDGVTARALFAVDELRVTDTLPFLQLTDGSESVYLEHLSGDNGRLRLEVGTSEAAKTFDFAISDEVGFRLRGANVGQCPGSGAPTMCVYFRLIDAVSSTAPQAGHCGSTTIGIFAIQTGSGVTVANAGLYVCLEDDTNGIHWRRIG